MNSSDANWMDGRELPSAATPANRPQHRLGDSWPQRLESTAGENGSDSEGSCGDSPGDDGSLGATKGALSAVGIREIVIVDSLFDRYGDFVAAASEGAVGLHFCNDGLSALKLARRFRGDIWLVSTELPDMSGFDLLPILLDHVQQGGVDPLLNGPRISLESLGVGLHAGVFMVSDLYRIEEEQRALACGSAGYLVRPITLDLVRALREPGRALPKPPRSTAGIIGEHRS